MKKRSIIFLLSLILIITGCSFSTNEGQRAKFDRYVNNTFGYDLFLNFDNINHISLGKAICIEGTSNYITFVYPVYEDNELISFFELTNINGEWGYAYPSDVGERIKDLWAIDDSEFTVFMKDGILHGYAGNKVINFHTNEAVDANIFSGKLPEKKQYDKTERISFKIPDVKSVAEYYSSSASYSLSPEEAVRFVNLLAGTRRNCYSEYNGDSAGLTPQYSYHVTIGYETYDFTGTEPLGSPCVITGKYWCTINPFSELFDFNREMMIRYAPEVFEKVSDKIYEKVCRNGFELLSYAYSETFDYKNNPAEIDYGVYAATDSTEMSIIFRELNIVEESDMTLSEYFGTFTDDAYDVNTVVECDKFYMKLIGKGKKGITYYIRSKEAKYNTYDGFVIHDK